MLNSNVRRFIASHGLMTTAGVHLVALSGGADSVALLLVLMEAGYKVEAAHCNFHLRGDESDRDEQFCKELCCRCGVPLHLAHFDTRVYAELHKVSIEMAARDLRYGYFDQLRRDIGAETICVAHHREDSVETVLLNLVRGTGIDGLTGIAPKNGRVVRPLLDASRKDILDYLDKHHQDYVTDSSNLVNDVKRNKLRLDIIPLLQDINPSVTDSIYQTSLRLREAAKAANSPVIHDKYSSDRLPLAALCGEPSPEYVLWHRLGRCGFTPSQVEDMAAAINGGCGAEWLSPSHVVVKDREVMVVAEREFSVPADLVIPETGMYIYDRKMKIRVTEGIVDSGFVLSRSPWCVMLDAGMVKFPLTIRRVSKGERFVPLGMKGTKLVSDYLTDRKRNILEKRRQLVATDGSGKIIWLLGERPDDRYKITDDSRRFLKISIES